MTNQNKSVNLRPGQIPRDNDLRKYHYRILLNEVMRAREVGLIDIPEFKAARAALDSVTSVPHFKLWELARALTKAIKEEGFSRPGEKARFAVEDEYYFRRATDSEIENLLLEAQSLIDDGFVSKAIPYLRKASNSIDINTSSRLKKILSDMMREANVRFSRPGQPERFAVSGWQTIEAYVQVLAEEFGTSRGKEAAQVMMRAADALGGNAPAALKGAIRTAATSKNVADRDRAIGQIEDMLESASFSRPGQPERFDASSLDRGDFADASTSPILGKLLAAKAMPEGGWRAVQAGSDTLVISFEDADLASDFGRRVASKGYNATSPVQAIGRYWNVEVKNGK